jgi:hypothetical protein
MAAEDMSAEIPCWIFGQLKWVSGINRNTTAEEVILINMSYFYFFC